MSAALVAELRRAIGDAAVLDDPASLLAYESDALTLFRSRPAAVALPADAASVQACVRILHRAQVPFAARGAGTGLSGGALVPAGGVVIATARMRRLLALDPARRLAIVEPGMVNAELSRLAAPHGLRFAPDPASQAVSTIGGNVAENSGGPMCFLHGTTGPHVRALDLVLADGTRESWGSPTAADPGFDLRGFCVGSEGTVGIVVAATLRLVPLPERVVTLLAAFASVGAACEAVAAIVAAGLRPAAMEVMDQRAIRAVEASAFRAGLPTDAGAVLIVEIEGPAARAPRDAARAEEALRAHAPSRLDRAEDPARRLAIWKGRKGAGGALGRLGPDSYVMDGVVPRSRLAEVMRFVDEVGEQSGLPVANLFHAGDGNIHPHFSYDARDPRQVETVERAGARILRKCLELGGSLTGEHGVGLEKQHLLGEQFAPAELALMERVRRVFDPAGLLNPGKGLPLGAGCAEAFHRHGRIAS